MELTGGLRWAYFFSYSIRVEETIDMENREILIISDRIRDPVKNLFREEKLFHQFEAGKLPEVARFWTNSECLIRGKVRNRRYGWYNEKLAKKIGVRVLERSTGGGVVYQDEGNLNWAFYLRTGGLFLSPTTLFGQASKYVVDALEDLGVEANFSPPNRIDVGGCKVSGMAAKSTKHSALVHGTLLLRSDLDQLNRLCIPPPGCPPVENLSHWATNIHPSIVVDSVVKALRKSGYRINRRN
jgi:lipoate-protein ligase A